MRGLGRSPSMMGDSPRRWSPEFKRDAVALVRSSGRPISVIARELGCGESSLGRGTGGGTRDPETICGLVGEGVDAVIKYAFIDAHRAEFQVVDLCRVGGVSTCGFYGWQARRA